MTFKRVKPRGQNRTQRTLNSFHGYAGGMGRTDLPDWLADVEDFRFENNIMQQREGKANIGDASADSTESLFEVNLGGVRHIGRVSAGNLNIQPATELT